MPRPKYTEPTYALSRAATADSAILRARALERVLAGRKKSTAFLTFAACAVVRFSHPSGGLPKAPSWEAIADRVENTHMWAGKCERDAIITTLSVMCGDPIPGRVLSQAELKTCLAAILSTGLRYRPRAFDTAEEVLDWITDLYLLPPKTTDAQTA